MLDKGKNAIDAKQLYVDANRATVSKKDGRYYLNSLTAYTKQD